MASATFAALRTGLQEHGYTEAQGTIGFETRYAEGRFDRFRALVEDLTKVPVDIIFVGGDQLIAAAMQASTTIPIVMVACDAVAAGLVTNLARPGGNVTGITCITSELAAKRLEILKEALPKVTRVGVVLNPEDQRMRAELAETEAAARALRLIVQRVPLTRLQDLEPVVASAVAERNDALVVVFDALTFLHRRRLLELTTASRLPTIHNFREYVEAGALLSYGPNLRDMWRRGAKHVDRILRGAKPGDLPVEQPTKFELVVNRKTARALGVTIPPSVLLRADDVIE